MTMGFAHFSRHGEIELHKYSTVILFLIIQSSNHCLHSLEMVLLHTQQNAPPAAIAYGNKPFAAIENVHSVPVRHCVGLH